MGRWLARLRDAEKSSETPPCVTVKTDKTPPDNVLSVLTVGGRGVLKKKIETEFAPGPLPIARPLASAGLSLEDQIAAFEERAGILEYDEGLPRSEAEKLAREQTRHLLH